MDEKKQRFMDQLFSQFQLGYTDKFFSNLKYYSQQEQEQVCQEWKECWADQFVLSRLTQPQLIYALSNVFRVHPSWPPAVGEFIQLAKSCPPSHYAKITHQEPRKPIPEEARKAIEALKTGDKDYLRSLARELEKPFRDYKAAASGS